MDAELMLFKDQSAAILFGKFRNAIGKAGLDRTVPFCAAMLSEFFHE